MLLLALGVLVLVIQVGYWVLLGRGFSVALRLSVGATRTEPGQTPTVIVAARNEAHRVGRLINALARQSLTPGAIVLVDDGSRDGTADVARRTETTGIPLSIISLDDTGGNKKAALTEGIRQAATPLLVFTDADCEPERDWVLGMARLHAAHPDEPLVVVGYSPFRPGRGMLNYLARYETFVTGVLTASAIGLGRPYMAVGRSLSYRRETFDSVDGFAQLMMVRSGDDDLFVQQVVRRGAARIVPLLEPSTRVQSDGPETWSAWLRQKRRHISAARHYDRRPALHLALLQGSSVGIWLLPLLLGWIGAGMLLIRLLVQFFVLRRAARSLGEQALLPAYVALDLLYMLYNALVVPLALLKVRREW